MCVNVCVCIGMYVRVCVYMCRCMLVHVRVCAYLRMCVRVRAHRGTEAGSSQHHKRSVTAAAAQSHTTPRQGALRDHWGAGEGGWCRV